MRSVALHAFANASTDSGRTWSLRTSASDLPAGAGLDQLAIDRGNPDLLYALSNGLCNGDVVTHILAFSAGFMTVLAQDGAPYVFIAHGSKDEQTPVETAGPSA